MAIATENTTGDWDGHRDQNNLNYNQNQFLIARNMHALESNLTDCGKTLPHLLDEPLFAHYSFDLWGTLIKSNPDFKKERSLCFFNGLNPLRKPLETIEKIFRKVDLTCNAINEKTGSNIDAEEMYLMVLTEIGENYDFSQYDLATLYETMENLLLVFTPCVYHDRTIETLSTLKSRGATISLLSNTAFVKGQTLRKVLIKIGLSEYFDFQLYSDETGFSKPNPDMFAIMHRHILHLNSNISKNEIVHVGDNKLADIQGAQRFGIRSYWVNTTSTIEQI